MLPLRVATPAPERPRPALPVTPDPEEIVIPPSVPSVPPLIPTVASPAFISMSPPLAPL